MCNDQSLVEEHHFRMPKLLQDLTTRELSWDVQPGSGLGTSWNACASRS